MTETDAILHRVERNAIIACVSMTITAAILAHERVAAAGGVIAGGAIAAVSYRGIKAGADALAGHANPANHPNRGQMTAKSAVIGLVKFFTRYGILAAVAYVIMARARVPPIAVIAGASSLVVAIMVEAARRGP